MARSRRRADRHLAEVDPVLARLIAKHGPSPLRRSNAPPFAALVRSIVSQMISGKAARTVHTRLLELLDEASPTPTRVAACSPATLRSAGLSRTKARALQDLAQAISSGNLPLEAFSDMDDAEVRSALTGIHGIGEWTAQMFLIFHLARPDVFPARDLGVQEGIKRAYGLLQRPSPREAQERAKPWAPFRSTAAWYMWRVVDEE